MKKITIIAGLLLIASSSQATIRSLHLDRSNLFLHEKIAHPENLLDNPAQLNTITQYYIENNTDLQLETIKPYDAVYQKENHQDSISNISQVIVPVENWFCVHAGYAYQHSLITMESISTLDNSAITSFDKRFVRTNNASIATTQVADIALGYTIRILQQDHFIDYSADIANDYTYCNAFQTMQHGLGIIYKGIELYGGLSTGTYTGDYQKIREIEFALDTWEINVRRLFGNMNEENILVQMGMENTQLTHALFEIGRIGYDLDILNYEISATAYYTKPGKILDLSVGLELGYQDKTIFDITEYDWVNYTRTTAIVPAQIKVQIFQWLALWLEMQLRYQDNTYEKTQTTSLQSAFGVQATVHMLEIQLYSLPGFTITNSESSDTLQNIQVGITATARF